MTLVRGVDTVACPRCGAGNPEDFRFCSCCGYARRGGASARLPSVALHVDLAAIDQRWASLARAHAQSRHVQAQSRELSALRDFLVASRSPRDLATCTPEDVIRFMVWRDLTGAGRTVVHAPACESIGLRARPSCSCPRRMAADSVRKLLSQLTSAFVKLGRTGPWQPASLAGNPAESPLASAYVGWIKEEQGRAGVTPHHTTPLLLDTHAAVCTRVLAISCDPLVTPFHRLQAFRDLAWYSLAWALGKRNGQIGSTLFHSVFVHPDGRLIFNWTWGKTVRDASSPPVAVSPNVEHPAVCPVRHVRAWVAAARRAGMPLTGGYLFPDIYEPTPDEAQFPLRILAAGQPGDRARMNVRFTERLKRWNMFKGETLHGTRGGSALSSAFAGESEAAINARVGWSPHGDTQQLYTATDRVCVVVGGCEGAAGVSPEQYRDWNQWPLLPPDRRAQFSL